MSSTKSLHNKLLSAPKLKNHYYALRHGQSLANVQKIISSDPAISTVEHGLSDVGREQVLKTAQEFAKEFHENKCADRFRGVLVLASDFTRARQTAAIFHETLKEEKVPLVHLKSSEVSPELQICLRERYFGEWNGGSDVHYHDVWKDDSNDADHTIKGVESVNQVVTRTTNLILDIEQKLATGEDVNDKPCKCVLVAHGDVLQILQTAFQKVDGRLHRTLPHLETAKLRELELNTNIN
mmetsp:Transcript_18202/g.25701  ORF Transcript_18202/g.25701 Transcript_18202/m.25701 type:complete len:239 (+) Transcript_18202:46-762(+)